MLLQKCFITNSVVVNILQHICSCPHDCYWKEDSKKDHCWIRKGLNLEIYFEIQYIFQVVNMTVTLKQLEF